MEPLLPLPRLIVCKAPQISFETTVHHLCLSISLEVIGRALLELCALEGVQSLPKGTSEGIARSEMMERGIPCNQTTSRVNFAATSFVENGCLRPMKCAYLLRQLTTTIIVSIPPDLGNPYTKSIDRSSHTY